MVVDIPDEVQTHQSQRQFRQHLKEQIDAMGQVSMKSLSSMGMSPPPPFLPLVQSTWTNIKSLTPFTLDSRNQIVLIDETSTNNGIFTNKDGRKEESMQSSTSRSNLSSNGPSTRSEVNYRLGESFVVNDPLDNGMSWVLTSTESMFLSMREQCFTKIHLTSLRNNNNNNIGL